MDDTSCELNRIFAQSKIDENLYLCYTYTDSGLHMLDIGEKDEIKTRFENVEISFDDYV